MSWRGPRLRHRRPLQVRLEVLPHRGQCRDEQHHVVFAGIADLVLGVLDEERVPLGEDDLDANRHLLGRGGGTVDRRAKS